MAAELTAQEERAVAKYGHHKEADESWPPEHAGKFALWLAQLHEYERQELAEQSARPARRGAA